MAPQLHPMIVLRLAAVLALALTAAACASKDTQTVATSGSQSGMAQDPVIAPEPMGPPEGTEEHFLVSVQNRVFFDYDRHDLNARAREVLARQAAWLNRYPGVAVLVEGHCDERGTREYNLALGARRAASVKDYLVGLGISPQRVRTISYGKERPEAPGSNPASWRLNRRSVTTVMTAPGA
ncbi:MAG: peptidoglycan-associated lipoprotein Pal [Alphaproteobacteria bacterium]